MALPKKAFGVQMDAADLMIGGVRSHLEKFSKRGSMKPLSPSMNLLWPV